MLKIIKASEPMNVERLNLCIYGPPGLGKTSLAFTAEAPLLLDCDGGSYRAANRKDAVPVSSWADISSITAEDLAPYKTVVVDTAGRALDFLTQDIIAGNPKMGRGGALTLQGYGELKAKFTSWLKMLRTLGKDVILLAHMDEQRSGDDIVERLDVQGGSKAEIYKSVDAMGRIVLRNGARFIDFSPRENAFGKNPCSLELLPFPNPNETDGTCLAIIIQTIKERVNKLTEVQKQTAKQITDWKLMIDEFKSPDDFNDHLAALREAPQSVKALASKKAKACGLTFDKQRDLYVESAHAGAGH